MRRLAVLLLLAPLLVACGASEKTVTVGALYPTAGPQGGGGGEEQRGARLAVEWVNKKGGIDGREIRLQTVAADRAEAVPRALAQLRNKGVTLVLGSHGSTMSAIAARETARTNMSFWETGAVGEVEVDGAGGRTFFRLAPMGATLGRHAISFVRDTLAPKLPPHDQLRYAVVYIDDPYGRAVGKGAEAEVQESGQVLAGTFPYDPTTTDFAPLATLVEAARADVLFAVSYLDDGVALRRATARLPLKAAIGTSSSFCHPAFGDRLGDEAVGLFASDKPDAAHVNPEALEPDGREALAWVSRTYKARFGEEMSAPALSGFSSAVALLGYVAPAARRLTTEGLSEAAAKVKLPEGTLANGAGLDLAPPDAFDAGANRRSAGVIWEWVAPRTRAVVWPPSLATQEVLALQVQR